jgi:DNA-binding NarL/FixJ family response regulator
MIRVVLADDHPVVRFALQVLVNAQDDMEVVDTAADGLGAVTSTVYHDPDLVVLDLLMPTLDGLEATEEIIRCNPRTRVLVLSSYCTDAITASALEAGATGVVLKNSGPWDLLAAMRAAHRGQSVSAGSVVRVLAAR